MPPKSKISSILCGVSGEYFVAAELSRRGYIASITLRNTRGVDILASNLDATKSAGIQVKTNQGSERVWLLNQKAESGLAENLFYIFVDLNGQSASPSFHVVPSHVVSKYCQTSHAEWLSKPGRGGRVRNDSPMRKFKDPEGKYLNAWGLLRLDAA